MNNQFQTQHLRNTKVQETSATGGGTTGGAAFTPGTGEKVKSSLPTVPLTALHPRKRISGPATPIPDLLRK